MAEEATGTPAAEPAVEPATDDVTAGAAPEPKVDDITSGAGDHWSNSLPEEHRKAFAEFASIEDAAAAVKGPSVPEKYETPEGIKPEDLGSFLEEAKAMGLSQEQFSAILKVDAKRTEDVTAKIQEQAAADMKVGMDKLKEKLGSEGYAENLKAATGLISRHTTADERQWLKETGLASHPMMHSILGRVGSQLSEDSPAPSNDKDSVKKPDFDDVAQSMFSKSVPATGK